MNSNVPEKAYSANYVRYAVGMLVAVYVCNFADRQILSILMQPIKIEMQLSDTELGLLSGLAFAIFYSVMGLPIGWLADKYSRVNILTICLTLWSAMTVLSGLAANFTQLFTARLFVGVGEAGGNPPSHSLISDYVPALSRSTALGIFALSAPVGLLVGFLLGGWIEQYYGWRAAFFALGAPGLVLAVILKLSLPEPPRGNADGSRKAGAVTPSMMAVLRHLWRIPSFRQFALGGSLAAFGIFSIFQWMPSFLARSYHMQSGEIGTWLALVIGVSGAAGSFAGGYLADRLSKRDMRWQMWVPAIGVLLAAPFCFAVFLAGAPMLSIGLLATPIMLVYFFLGPSFALTQTLSPQRMRAMASAVLLTLYNFIGLGIGPTVVGIVSDWLTPVYGDESLRYAMLLPSSILIWGAYHLMRAGRTLREDLQIAAG